MRLHFPDSPITNEMVKKTREKFIEVARQLFARKGVENTTMNDIASASDKGRRTIYTYFKSKREIFNAVIDNESEQLLQRLRVIVAQAISPEEKLREYVDCRLQTMREIVSRNGSLRAGFFRDVRKVDRARAIISRKEAALLMEILREGIETGDFEIESVKESALIIVNAIQGLDVPYIRDGLSQYGMEDNTIQRVITDLILHGIVRR
ncbi:MAG: TetR family transcriptional regulator [Bacteroides sp.]|nr:TetR family transcriptional regulator [Bacteroides sp.]